MAESPGRTDMLSIPSARGFSTLEIVIAMSVLVLAISATLVLLPTSAYVDSELSAHALRQATRTLEEQEALSRKDFSLVVATTTRETIDGIEFTTDIDVEPIDFYLERVVVSVSWGAQYGRTQKTSLSTLLSNFENSEGGDTCHAFVSGIWNFPHVDEYVFGSIRDLDDSSGSYPLTDIEVHRNRLYATVNMNVSTLPSEGPNGGTRTVVASRTGTVSWSSSANARTSDNQYATAVLGPGQRTQYLVVDGFGFSIPPGATILGISVDVERKNSSTVQTTKDASVRIVRSDGTFGSVDKARSTNWPTSDAYSTYGSSNDLWNESDWSPAAINSDGFGVAFAAEANAGSATRTASVDHVRITVTYTKQFYVVDVAHTPALVGGLGQNTISTGMNAVSVATSTTNGSHAYVALNSQTTQLEILDISDPLVRVVGSYRITGASAVANTITYKDGYVYLGLENSPASEFNIIDVHVPSSPTLVGNYEIGAGVNSISVKDGQAYLATDDVNRELIVLDIRTLSHPTLLTSYNAPGASPGQGKSLAVIGDSLFLGRYYSSNAPEFMRFDVSHTAPLITDTRDIGVSGNTVGVYDLAIRDHLAFLLTGNEAGAPGKLQILDLLKQGTIASISLPNNGEPRALTCEGDTLYTASVPRTGTYAGRGSISRITSL